MTNGRGWFKESQRHSLAARGIRTVPEQMRSRGHTDGRPRIDEFFDESLWMTDPYWKCVLEQDDIHLGLYVNMVDMREYDRDYNDKEYPVVLDATVMVIPEEMSPEFLEDVGGYIGDPDVEPTPYDVYHYAGGVPATHILEGVTSGHKSDVPSIVEEDQHGKKWRSFRSIEDAEQYAKEVYAYNAHAVFGLIGFLLDRPINLVGDDGWDVIRLQKNNENYISRWHR